MKSPTCVCVCVSVYVVVGAQVLTCALMSIRVQLCTVPGIKVKVIFFLFYFKLGGVSLTGKRCMYE